jgi:hypothetical protein
MLFDSDTETVKKWLIRALDLGSELGQTKTALASYCKVTPQAVDGWLRTGRITKRNLELAKHFFGSGPSFTTGHTEQVAQQGGPQALVRWPFRLVDHREIEALPVKRRQRLDRLLRERINEWAEDDAAATGKRQRAA